MYFVFGNHFAANIKDLKQNMENTILINMVTGASQSRSEIQVFANLFRIPCVKINCLVYVRNLKTKN